ncbi:MAG: methyltransferase domain-containing protein [Alphaproteobacteria bacterium]|nr:methyltransferase domain-containing protein [Alphaproteobacteria bacterium]
MNIPMALLKQFKTPFGIIRVLRDRDGTLAYYQNGCFHSQSTARGISLCAYAHVLCEIIRQKKACKVLVIGCGGGNVATMLRRHQMDVTVVDINPMAFSIARDYFAMPNDVVCITQNGLTYVRTIKERFDAVVIDVFDSHNNVPSGFTTKSFLGAARKVLRRGGVLIMNTITKNDKDHGADVIARHVNAAGMKTTIYEWSKEKDRNALIVGGTVKNISIPSGKEPAFIKQQLKKLVMR